MCEAIINCTSILFLFCFYGKLATESFLGICDSAYEANWLDLPTHLQKYFIIIIGNAQIPLYYHGFDIAVLNLETFMKMMRTVMSYYLMFRTITE